LFTVEIRIDGDYFKKVALAKPLDVRRIINENLDNGKQLRSVIL